MYISRRYSAAATAATLRVRKLPGHGGYPCYSVNGQLTCGPQPMYAPQPQNYYPPQTVGLPTMTQGAGIPYPSGGTSNPYIARGMHTQSVEPAYDGGREAAFVSH